MSLDGHGRDRTGSCGRSPRRHEGHEGTRSRPPRTEACSDDPAWPCNSTARGKKSVAQRRKLVARARNRCAHRRIRPLAAKFAPLAATFPRCLTLPARSGAKLFGFRTKASRSGGLIRSLGDESVLHAMKFGRSAAKSARVPAKFERCGVQSARSRENRRLPRRKRGHVRLYSHRRRANSLARGPGGSPQECARSLGGEYACSQGWGSFVFLRVLRDFVVYGRTMPVARRARRRATPQPRSQRTSFLNRIRCG